MPSYLCLEGCGLWAKCKNRGRRTRLQRRLCRLRSRSVSGFFVAGVADPGRGAERLSERFFGRGRRPDSNPYFRIRVLKDVACGPNVKTGAGLPGDRGGLQNPVR